MVADDADADAGADAGVAVALFSSTVTGFAHTRQVGTSPALIPTLFQARSLMTHPHGCKAINLFVPFDGRDKMGQE